MVKQAKIIVTILVIAVLGVIDFVMYKNNAAPANYVYKKLKG